jgi:hypothetical protein
MAEKIVEKRPISNFEIGCKMKFEFLSPSITATTPQTMGEVLYPSI